ASIFVNKERKPSRGSKPAADLWRYVQVNQDGQQNRLEWVGSADAVGTIRYPGPQISIKLFETDVEGPPDKSRELRLEAPWAALHMLWQNARRDETNQKKWAVELTVLDAQAKPRSIWLDVVFDSTVPAIEDWPKWSNTPAAGA